MWPFLKTTSQAFRRMFLNLSVREICYKWLEWVYRFGGRPPQRWITFITISYHIISGGMLVYGFRESISSLKTLSFYLSSPSIPYVNLSFWFGSVRSSYKNSLISPTLLDSFFFFNPALSSSSICPSSSFPLFLSLCHLFIPLHNISSLPNLLATWTEPLPGFWFVR